MKVTQERGSLFLPSPKRPRSDSSSASKNDVVPPALAFCQYLLQTSDDHQLPGLPSTLGGAHVREDTAKLKRIFDSNGFRTSLVSSPREALSVYKDSAHLFSDSLFSTTDGKTWLVTLLGMHPNQYELEHFFRSSVKDVFCLMLFCQRLRDTCKRALEDSNVADLVAGCELQCRSLGRLTTTEFTSSQILQHAQSLASSVPQLVANLIKRVVHAEPRNRVEQLKREFERIQVWNSTLSNALVSIFTREHQCCIKDMVFKQSHQPQYERITVFLHNPEHDYNKPPHFLFMPALSTILREGPHALGESMLQSFWSHLIRHGYFATQAMKDRLSANLKAFFLSGITQGPNLPIHLKALFVPTRPLSFYLHGRAGAGKSSFVRTFQPALESTIEEAVDPDIVARFVKQNLNKRLDTLELELQLRPNNNDLSVMSIIQGRRMTMTQSKPGLVVVDLEEMPSNAPNADPNQLKVAQLISQRFSGRNGDFQPTGKSAPRNSDKRGIANDASLVTLFTSNYHLDEASREALKRLKMFEYLGTVDMAPVSGDDRLQFANTYLRQCIKDNFSELKPKFDITLDIAVGEGDTRTLVKYLRMVSFYICSLVTKSVRYDCTIEARVKQKGLECMIFAGGESIELKLASLGNLFPSKLRLHDPRIHEAMASLKNTLSSVDEISIILDFWFAKTLAPAVIVSTDRNKIVGLMDAVSTLQDVFCIRNVNASSYKMMKSLYDPNDTPNLRDDILKFGRGANVAIEIECPSTDDQLCIREIIEDSPSMTAFSTAKSALFKEGLLFAVHVCGDITPEVRSRASFIL